MKKLSLILKIQNELKLELELSWARLFVLCRARTCLKFKEPSSNKNFRTLFKFELLYVLNESSSSSTYMSILGSARLVYSLSCWFLLKLLISLGRWWKRVGISDEAILGRRSGVIYVASWIDWLEVIQRTKTHLYQ